MLQNELLKLSNIIDELIQTESDMIASHTSELSTTLDTILELLTDSPDAYIELTQDELSDVAKSSPEIIEIPDALLIPIGNKKYKIKVEHLIAIITPALTTTLASIDICKVANTFLILLSRLTEILKTISK